MDNMVIILLSGVDGDCTFSVTLLCFFQFAFNTYVECLNSSRNANKTFPLMVDSIFFSQFESSLLIWYYNTPS